MGRSWPSSTSECFDPSITSCQSGREKPWMRSARFARKSTRTAPCTALSPRREGIGAASSLRGRGGKFLTLRALTCYPRAARREPRSAMRIGVLAHNYPPHPGGLEVMVENVSARLAERHDVVVVTAAWAEAPRVESRGRLRIHRLPALHHTERRGVPYPVVYGPGVASALRELRSCDVL